MAGCFDTRTVAGMRYIVINVSVSDDGEPLADVFGFDDKEEAERFTERGNASCLWRDEVRCREFYRLIDSVELTPDGAAVQVHNEYFAWVEEEMAEVE